MEGSGTPRALAVKLPSYCLCLGAYSTHKWDFFPPFLLSTLLISLAKLSLIGLGPHITFMYFLQACLWYGKGSFFSLFCPVCPILSVIFYLQFSLKVVHFGILLNLKQDTKLKEVEARDQGLKVNLRCSKNLKPA